MRLIDAHDKDKCSLSEQELTVEQFFERFAALEDGLAILQIHLRDLSENAKLFGGLARHIRRSTCPADSVAEKGHVPGGYTR